MDEFHARIGETPHTWVEWASSQLLQNTPLHPIAEWGRIRSGGADVALERRLAELEGTLSQVKLDPGEFVPLLAPLLEIPFLRTARRNLRRRSSGVTSSRRSLPGFSPGRARSRSCSPSRICIGRIRHRSI